MKFLAKLELPLFTISALLIAWSNYLVFMVVPNEKIMGAVQRIFYFHVGSAIACYCAFGVVFGASVCYLAFRNHIADIVNEAASEIGFVFCSMTLITGMIWGHSAWNTWFRWEPRLVTFLLLWLIALSLNLLRRFGDRSQIAAHCSILGILGSLTVPFVWISVKFLPQMAQLHPQVVENRGLKDPAYLEAMFVCMGALVVLQFALLVIRIRLGFLETRQRS